MSKPAAAAAPSPASAPPPVPPTVVVAGTGHRELVAELLAEVTPAGDLAAAPPAAYLLLRHGPAGGRAYIPGHRRPRDLTDAGPDAGPPTRPPRRVALSHPAPLLEYVHLVAAPEVAPSAAGTDVLVDALRHADGLVYVLDATGPLPPDRRTELVALAGATVRIVLVELRDADDADRARIVRQVPALAGARWVPASDPAALRAALTAAGFWLVPPGGITDDGSAAEEVPDAPGAVRATDDDARWRTALQQQACAAQSAVRLRVSTELAGLDARCGTDPCALPARLDTELHALSLRTTEALDATANGLIAAVFGEVVLGRLSEVVRARVVTAVRRHVDPDDRTLLVTATAGVAAVSGAADAVSATGAAAQTVLPPVSIAVSGNCHLTWLYRGVPDKADARRWLHQAVHALERELGRLVDQRFAALTEAVEALAAEAVDHGVLLA